MKLKHLLFLLLTISLQNCSNKDCGKLQIDNQSLENESQAFDVYENQNKIIFLDSAGNEYEYKESFKLDDNQRNAIHPFECNGETRYVQYNGEYKVRSFDGPDSTGISFVIQTTFTDEEAQLYDDNIVDLLWITILDKSVVPNPEIAQLQIVTSDKLGGVDKSDFNESMNTFDETIDLFGQDYEDVFNQKNTSTNSIYFNKEIGVISFSNKNNVALIFDRFE